MLCKVVHSSGSDNGLAKWIRYKEKPDPPFRRGRDIGCNDLGIRVILCSMYRPSSASALIRYFRQQTLKIRGTKGTYPTSWFGVATRVQSGSGCFLSDIVSRRMERATTTLTFFVLTASMPTDSAGQCTSGIVKIGHLQKKPKSSGASPEGNR